MATLKKNKRKQEEEVKEIIAESTATEVVEDKEELKEAVFESKYMNSSEQEALTTQHEEDTKDDRNVSYEKMTKAVLVAQNEFNLSDKDFAVTGFADKGSKCQLSFTNGDFDVVVTVKDTEKYGIL